MTKNYFKDISNEFSDLIKFNREILGGMDKLPMKELSEKILKVQEACKKINNDLIEWKMSMSLAGKMFTRQNSNRRELRKIFEDFCNHNNKEITDRLNLKMFEMRFR